jgi:hypothetical protein
MGQRPFPRQEKLKFIVKKILEGASEAEIQDALTQYGPDGYVKGGYGVFGEVGSRTIANIKSVVVCAQEMLKVNQLALSPWVQRAQQLHLFGFALTGDHEGLETVTFQEVGVRQHLDSFKGCFGEITPAYPRFWHPQLLDDPAVMTELRGHLPDPQFWQQVEGDSGFIKAAQNCEGVLDDVCRNFISKGEELAPLQPVSGPPPWTRITSAWARQVLVQALGQQFGCTAIGRYYLQKLQDESFQLEVGDSVVYSGPNGEIAEQRHRQLVDEFKAHDKRYGRIRDLMLKLRELRQDILVRIDRCLHDKEYAVNDCPSCPVVQARRRGSLSNHTS